MNARTLSTLFLGLAMTPAASAQQPTLRLEHDSARAELVFTIGPIDLPNGEHHAHGDQPPTQAIALPVDAYLHGFTTEIVDTGGNVLPNVLLHHVNIMAPGRRELFSNIMQRVGAAGAETGAVVLPKMLGYHVAAGDSLVFTAMFHNPTERAYTDATLRVRMSYSPAHAPPTMAIQPFYVDVMPPAGIHAYALPPGRSKQSWEGKPAVAGRVLALGGHMHKYGTVLRFEDVTANTVLWEAAPQLDDKGNVKGMPRKFFLDGAGIQLRPEHTYRLTVEYDNPGNEAIENGAMGTLGGVMVPVEGSMWPPVDRSHPEYLADLDVMYPERKSSATQHRGHH